MDRVPNPLLVAVILISAFAVVGALESCSREGARAVAEKLAGNDAGAGPPVATESLAQPPVAIPPPAEPPASAAPPPAPSLALPHEDADSDLDHLELAGSALVAGDTALALEQYRMRLAHAEDDASALWGVARTGDALDARLVPLALEALALRSPSDPRPLTTLARRHLARKEIEDALQVSARAVARDPASADAHNTRGRALLAAGQLSRAIAAFEKATRLDPRHGFAWNNLGYALLQAARFTDAIGPLEIAVSLEPATAYIWNNLGVAYEKSGRRAEARLAFQRAHEMAPSYVKAAVNYARAARQDVVAAAPPADRGGAPAADAASE